LRGLELLLTASDHDLPSPDFLRVLLRVRVLFLSANQVDLLGMHVGLPKARVYACMHVCMSYVCKPFEAKLLSTAIMVDCDYDDTRVHVFCIVTRCPECTPDLLPNKSSLWSSMSY